MIRSICNVKGCALALALTGCATTVKAPEIPLLDSNSFSQAQATPEPKRPVQIVEVPKPLPLPGQLKPVPAASAKVKDEATPKDVADHFRGEPFVIDFGGFVESRVIEAAQMAGITIVPLCYRTHRAKAAGVAVWTTPPPGTAAIVPSSSTARARSPCWLDERRCGRARL